MALPAKAAVRTADVLNLVAAHPRQRFTLSEISERLGIGNASIHGVLSALTDAGLLVRDQAKAFRLGPMAAAIGTVARHQDPVMDLAIRATEQAACHFDCRVALKQFDGTNISVLLALGGCGELAPTSPDQLVGGSTVDAAAPNGVVFMAAAAPHEVLRWLDAGRIGPTTAEAMALRQEVERARIEGWARAGRSVEVGFASFGDASLALCASDVLARDDEAEWFGKRLLEEVDRANGPQSLLGRSPSVA